MLKNGRPFGKDYFDELLERIREIRASERRAYQKITNVFEQCSYDYDKNSDITKQFYAFVQNKLHFAVTGMTAAQLIYERADAGKPTMGLTTWKDAPDGKIYRKDIGSRNAGCPGRGLTQHRRAHRQSFLSGRNAGSPVRGLTPCLREQDRPIIRVRRNAGSPGRGLTPIQDLHHSRSFF